MTLDDFFDGIVANDIKTIEVSSGTMKHGDEHGAGDYPMVTLTTTAGVWRLRRTDKGWIPL